MRGIYREPEAQPAAAEPGGRRDDRAVALVEALNGRSVVLVGMMGSGKTTVGRRLALRLGLPFIDVDQEIVEAAGMPIPDIFARHGEEHFRDGERRVMARVLAGGPRVVATGGGAFMNDATRARIADNAISIWLKADLDTLMRRVRKRATRPLLQTPDPVGTMQRLLSEREPIYAQADLTVYSREASHETVVEDVLSALETHVNGRGASSKMKRSDRIDIGVELPGRRYDIIIGDNLLAESGALIAKIAPGAACAVITDTNVARHHLPALAASLDAAGIRHADITIAPGETSKSFSNYERICDHVLAARMERGDIVVALGGGVVGDLAGFAAATVRRGMRLVQIPTTLLAQVDSSVGGKTGINSSHGKNLIGAFHQPSLVIADTSVLATLPEREFRAGYAEVVKYGLIDDADFFYWLEAEWRSVFAGGPGAHARDRQELRGQSCDRRPRRDRAGRPCAAQPRTYIRAMRSSESPPMTASASSMAKRSRSALPALSVFPRSKAYAPARIASAWCAISTRSASARLFPTFPAGKAMPMRSSTPCCKIRRCSAAR